MGLNNGKNLAAENRRSQVLQMKMAGATETAIAEAIGNHLLNLLVTV